MEALGQKDWGKLGRLLKHLHATVGDALTLDAGKGVHNVEWSVDSAFGVHPNFKSHVGGTMTFKGRKGLAINTSAKQKLNTKSLTVEESVEVDCAPPFVLWVPSFLREQDCDAKENVIKQDDKSTVPSAKNGKANSGK